MDKQKQIEIAKKKVKEKKEFYGHFNVFCIVSFTLLLISYFNSPNDWEIYKPLLIWAMSVFGHYIGVFGFPSLSFRDEIWEDKQFEKEMDKLDRQQTLELH